MNYLYEIIWLIGILVSAVFFVVLTGVLQLVFGLLAAMFSATALIINYQRWKLQKRDSELREDEFKLKEEELKLKEEELKKKNRPYVSAEFFCKELFKPTGRGTKINEHQIRNKIAFTCFNAGARIKGISTEIFENSILLEGFQDEKTQRVCYPGQTSTFIVKLKDGRIYHDDEIKQWHRINKNTTNILELRFCIRYRGFDDDDYYHHRASYVLDNTTGFWAIKEEFNVPVTVIESRPAHMKLEGKTALLNGQ